MAKIAIEPVKARAALDQQDALEKTLQSLSREVDGILKGLRYKIAGRENIARRLSEAAGQITKESQSTRALRTALEEAIALYEQTERENRDRVKAGKAAIQADALIRGIDPEVIKQLTLLLKGIVWGKAGAIPGLLAVISPVSPLAYLAGGLILPSVLSSSSVGEAGSTWLGYELEDGHPGVTAWVGKAGAKAEGNWGSAEVNGYIGKVEANAEADAKFMEYTKERKYVDGEWTEEENLSFVAAEVGIGAMGSILAGDIKTSTGNDMLGTEINLEGSAGNAAAEAKGEFSIGEDGVTANVSGKAMVSAVEGEASGTINFLGLEITGKIGGYAGAAGVEGKIGFEDNKWVMEGGAAALLGLSGGVEIGFNDEGWSNLWDMITFWD